MDEQQVLDHRKRNAVYLLVACQQDQDKVATSCGVTVQTLRKWMKEPAFRAKYEEAYKRLENEDSRKLRQQNHRLVLDKVWEEIHKRVATGRGLKDMSTLSLLRVTKDLNYETRLDDNEATAHVKTEHSLDKLIARHHEMKKAKHRPKLKLVEMPEEEKGEVANG